MGSRGMSSKVGGGSRSAGANNVDKFYTQSTADLIEDLARQMTTDDYDSRLDNGDMQSMAELYAVYNGLDDNAIINAVRNRAEQMQSGKETKAQPKEKTATPATNNNVRREINKIVEDNAYVAMFAQPQITKTLNKAPVKTEIKLRTSDGVETNLFTKNKDSSWTHETKYSFGKSEKEKISAEKAAETIFNIKRWLE